MYVAMDARTTKAASHTPSVAAAETWLYVQTGSVPEEQNGGSRNSGL